MVKSLIKIFSLICKEIQLKVTIVKEIPFMNALYQGD